jgi:methionyl-tRNA formyltransferase
MDKKNLRIIFMGTPEFAVASLQALVVHNYNVVAVITAPDKPAGRGMQLQQSAVKTFAVNHNIPVLQPEKLKNTDFITTLSSYNADLQIVVAFRMLPEVVWNMPPLGTINVHGSLLPNYRGAAPINWAIINGEKETGVTTFKLKHLIDTGNILLQEKISISETDTAGTIHDQMKDIGAKVLVQTIEKLITQTLTEQPQSHIPESTLKHAPKIFNETCKIDWNSSTESIYNLIRGLSPYPSAYTYLNEKVFKIFEAKKEIINHISAVGAYLTDNKTFLKFATIDGFIECQTIQLAGKRKMNIAEFLRGNTI